MSEESEVKLTWKQKAFIEEYLFDFNATQAALRAGYSERTATVIGYENLRKPYIQAEIKRRLEERAMKADEVLDRLTDIARADLGDFFNNYTIVDLKQAQADGKTKLIKKLKQRTITKIAKSEDDEDTEIHDLEIELYSAHEALRDLGKVYGLLVDRREISGIGGGPIPVAIVKMDVDEI